MFLKTPKPAMLECQPIQIVLILKPRKRKLNRNLQMGCSPRCPRSRTWSLSWMISLLGKTVPESRSALAYQYPWKPKHKKNFSLFQSWTMATTFHEIKNLFSNLGPWKPNHGNADLGIAFTASSIRKVWSLPVFIHVPRCVDALESKLNSAQTAYDAFVATRSSIGEGERTEENLSHKCLLSWDFTN